PARHAGVGSRMGRSRAELRQRQSPVRRGGRPRAQRRQLRRLPRRARDGRPEDGGGQRRRPDRPPVRAAGGREVLERAAGQPLAHHGRHPARLQEHADRPLVARRRGACTMHADERLQPLYRGPQPGQGFDGRGGGSGGARRGGDHLALLRNAPTRRRSGGGAARRGGTGRRHLCRLSAHQRGVGIRRARPSPRSGHQRRFRAGPDWSSAGGAVIEVLESAAREHGSVPAVIADDGSTTYGELYAGLRPVGGRQEVALPNGCRWVNTFWGAMAGGAAVVPLNPRAKPDEVDYIKRDFYCGEIAVHDVRVVQYTAGTTGRPKGALLTGEGLLTVARGHAESWRLQAGDVVFIPNPMTHIMGLVLGVLMPAISNATVLTMERFEPGAALELIERHRPGAMTGTPTHYHMLIEHPDLAARDVSSLKFGLAGGAASTPD